MTVSFFADINNSNSNPVRVARYVFEADHTGELLGIEATGKRVCLPGIFVACVEDGKLAEYWREEDQLGMLQQLGATPSSEQARV